MERRYDSGIIFDMDNTLLQSRIDFGKMKRVLYALLVENGLCTEELDWQSHTASQLIEIGRQSEKITPRLEKRMWDAVAAIETEGMHGAVLEEHAVDVLTHLHSHAHLFILTNNACAAAEEALRETGIAHLFEKIVAREQMTALKPCPSGIRYILERYPDVPQANWTMVGDSWIDGTAAQDGSVRFVAYKGNQQEMEAHQVRPLAYIEDLRELLSLDLIAGRGRSAG